MWRSLVASLFWIQNVTGSNLVIPTFSSGQTVLAELAQRWILLLLELPELTAEEAIGREESKLFILALALSKRRFLSTQSIIVIEL
ncbi:hypothetical protein V6N13_035026 [Hibiscus sabdariffa]